VREAVLLGYDRPAMDLYLQEPEVLLLTALNSGLTERSVIDVGAERGAFVASLLRGGSTEIHAIEPEPDNADFLRTSFENDPRVFVHEYAITNVDGPVTLHKSVSPSGEPLPYGHTLLERPDSDEIAWRQTISVTGRSLSSLVETGEVPRRVGILKVDTEGSDLAVVSGMGDLACDVVMIEHWIDLPHSLGRCPWSIDDFTSILRPRGFSQFAFLEHRGEFVLLKWNDATVGTGRMGNIVFLHDGALEALLPVLLECGSALAQENVELGETYVAEAHARLAVIEQLEQGRLAHRKPHRRAWARLTAWAQPRIGNLRQHEPKRLRLPAKYAETQPPLPAPTISVVTPSFQHGRFLERTLYSVISQKYPALEYVVQDGGSSDESVELLRRYEADLSLWRSEPDSGQADAINRGFRETTGEIMAWLNSDDLLLPGSLAYVAHYFAEHQDVDVVYGNRVMVDENDGQIGEWILPPHDDQTLTIADYIPQETLFWRRRIWEAAGGHVDSSFGYALDWDLLLRFRDAGATMVRLPRLLGGFRVHDEQKTTAEHVTGGIECDLIRRRLYGRPLLREEIRHKLMPYLLRHILAHTRYRLIDRLALRRFVVQTVPTDKGSQRPIAYDRARPVTSHAEPLVAGATSVEGVSSPPLPPEEQQFSRGPSVSEPSVSE
jgi:FkbM family methyltransferase